MTIELKIANEDDKELWGSIVEKSPHGTIFHTWKWLKITEKHTKSKLYPLMGFKGTEPIGLYPLFSQRKNFIKLVFSPPPKALLLYLGPIMLNYNELKQSKRESIFIEFQEKVDEFARNQVGYNCIRIRSSQGLIDSRPFIWNSYKVEPLYTYIINLNDNVDNLWNQFNKQLRIDINKTKKGGVVVEEDNRDGLDFLRSSISRRFREQGMKSSDFYRSYLYEIYDNFHPENFKVFIAKYKGERVGGFTLLCYKKRASLWMGIPKTNLKGIYPNDLAVWESIKWACENGYKEYEIMDAGDDPRLRHFKSKFNPSLSVWFSAIKYYPFVFEGLEKIARVIYKRLKIGGLT